MTSRHEKIASDDDLYVFVTAHPDDESMFFLPTIQALISRGETVWLLCLSTGNFNGLGRIREKELINAGKLLGFDQTIVCDTLQDHPTQRWKAEQVCRDIKTALSNNIPKSSKYKRINVKIITFDEGGISGHVNHIDTVLGVAELLRSSTTSLRVGNNALSFEGWQLETEYNLIAKYLPLLAWSWLLLSLFGWKPATTLQESDSFRQYALYEPSLNWRAMATHHSQFVWYRRLFVVFSCYTYVNKLRPIR
jgi:N-acetylglucosaminylphosphatidylinositol deacetylase